MYNSNEIMPPKLLKWYLSNILRKIEELDKRIGGIENEEEERKEKVHEGI